MNGVIDFFKKKLSSKDKMKEEFTDFAKFIDRKTINGSFEKFLSLKYKSYKGFKIGNKELYFYTTDVGIRFYCIILSSKKEVLWKIIGDDTVILSNVEDWIYLKNIKNEILNLLEN